MVAAARIVVAAQAFVFGTFVVVHRRIFVSFSMGICPPPKVPFHHQVPR